MSVEKTNYVIIGYDVTNSELFANEDFYSSDKYDELTCFQDVGKIQLFTDPMSSNYVRFGYILGRADEYDDIDLFVSCPLCDFQTISQGVKDEWVKFFGKENEIIEEPQLLCFVEYH